MSELLNGLRYSFNTPRINALTSMGLSAGCFGLFYSHVAPGFSRQVLGFEAGETGLFLMSMGIGSIIGSMIMLVVRVRDSLRMYFIGSMCLGLSIAFVAVMPVAYASFLPNALFGICLAVMIVSGQTVLQTEVPSEYLGRTMSVWVVAGGVGLAASWPIGALGDALGLRWVLLGAGLMLATVALLNGFVRTSTLRPSAPPPVPVARHAN